MPYQCQRCDFFSETADVCPQCGSRMTLTLLGGMKREEEQQRKVKVEESEGLGFGVRFGQVFFGLVWSQAVALILTGFFLTSVAFFGIEPAALATDHLWPYYTAVVVIPTIAVCGSIWISLRKVYLAQLVGLVVGVLSNIAFLAERLKFAHEPALWEWGAWPILGGVVGFVAGLRVAGKWEPKESVEYTLIDTWDDKTKPKRVYVNLTPQARWARVLKAFVWSILFHLLWLGFHALFHWIKLIGAYPLTGTLRDLSLDRGAVIAFLIGAMMSGMRTSSGAGQGFRFSLFFTAYHAIFCMFVRDPLPLETLGVVAVLFAIGGIFAGWFGSFTVTPTRHFVNRQETS